MDDLTTERCFDSQAICVVGVFLDMLSMGVFTTWYWQSSSRPVQELNVCTVATWGQGNLGYTPISCSKAARY